MLKCVIKKMLLRLRGEIPVEKMVERGLKLGKNVKILHGVILDYNHCWLIEIGDNVVIAPNVHVLAHDASSIHNKATRIGLVKIGNDTFIGASSIVLPGVTIGNNVAIGANSVVTHDIPDNSIAVGNPAKVIKNRTESEKEHNENLLKYPCYNWPQWGIEGGITEEQKLKMREDLKNSRFGYLISN